MYCAAKEDLNSFPLIFFFLLPEMVWVLGWPRNKLMRTYQGTQRVSAIAVAYHFGGYISHNDRAFNLNGNVVGIVTNPNRHLFTSGKYRSLDQEWSEFNGFEFTIFCPDVFLA
jgi:hypothetical protein